MSRYSGCASMMSSAIASMPSRISPARYLRQAPKKRSRTCSREGLNILGLRLELAEVADDALRAAGLAREAHVAAVQDEPVVDVLQEFRRSELQELLLHFQDILSWRNPGAVGDAEDMRVDS